MKIFSGSSNKELALKIAKELGITLSKLDTHIFPDGEKRVRVVDKVVDEDCVVVQPTSPPVDQNYMELFFIADAIKRSGAKSVTAVIPYLGYQRQDHVFRDGEAVSLEVIVETLEAVGINKVIVFDLHSIRIEQAFHVPLIHLSALPLFAEEIHRTTQNRTRNNTESGEVQLSSAKKTVLVSPDMGGIRRIKILSKMLNDMPYAAIVKNRNLETGELEASEVEGELRERAIIIDDMISSGGTIATACELLKKKGVKEIFVFATHAVFSKEAKDILQKSQARKIYVTDSIYVPKEKQFEKLEILSVAEIISKQLATSE